MTKTLALRRRLWLLLCLLPLVAGAQGKEKVRVRVTWNAQAQFAGLYVADAKGFFREEGVEVEILHPKGNQSSLSALSIQGADMFLDHVPSVLLYNDTTRGPRLVDVLQVSQHSSIVIVSHTPLNSLRDLQGLGLGCWHRGRNETVACLLRLHSVEVEWVPTESYTNAPFLTQAVDAQLTMAYNELFLLAMSGHPVPENKQLQVRKTDCDIPDDALFARRDYAEAHPDRVRAVAAAVQRGWEWLAQEENREEGLQIVLDYAYNNHHRTNPTMQRHMLNTMLDLQLYRGKRSFVFDPARFDKAVRQFLTTGIIRTPVRYEDFFFRP